MQILDRISHNAFTKRRKHQKKRGITRKHRISRRSRAPDQVIGGVEQTFACVRVDNGGQTGRPGPDLACTRMCGCRGQSTVSTKINVENGAHARTYAPMRASTIACAQAYTHAPGPDPHTHSLSSKCSLGGSLPQAN